MSLEKPAENTYGDLNDHIESVLGTYKREITYVMGNEKDEREA